jgi:hypothetical protein
VKQSIVVSAAASGLLLSVSFASAVGASPPHTVDPTTMTPELNPNFAPWTCTVTGAGITCQGEYDNVYTNEATDLVCDGQVVYVTGRDKAKTVRWHDADGLATKTSIQDNFVGDRLTLSPTGEAPYVVLSGTWHKHFTYPVPGDPTQRVLTETGVALKLRMPGGGVVFRDVGQVTYEPNHEYEVPVVQHGVHDRFSDADLDALICDGIS